MRDSRRQPAPLSAQYSQRAISSEIKTPLVAQYSQRVIPSEIKTPLVAQYDQPFLLRWRQPRLYVDSATLWERFGTSTITRSTTWSPVHSIPITLCSKDDLSLKLITSHIAADTDGVNSSNKPFIAHPSKERKRWYWDGEAENAGRAIGYRTQSHWFCAPVL